jgi:hypothetical protein
MAAYAAKDLLMPQLFKKQMIPTMHSNQPPATTAAIL